MTKIRFSGFPTGSNVSLSASQGGTTRGPVSISSWKTPVENSWAGVSADETLTVSVVEVIPVGPRFAPLGVEYRIKVTGSTVGNTPSFELDYPTGPGLPSQWVRSGSNTPTLSTADQTMFDTAFNAFGTYDPTFSRVHYVLHTGDTGNYRNERIGHASHRSKAFQYGQNPGHVYSNPGTYKRSIYVYDDAGKWGTLDLDDLVVADPDDAFAAARTIVVSNDANETWAGTPAHDVANRCTTITAAAARFALVKGTGSTPTGGVRVSVKSGQTFNEAVPNDIFFIPNVSDENISTFDMQWSRGRHLFDTWGGDAPMLYSERDSGVFTDGALFNTHAADKGGWPWTISNWTFDFGYDVDAGMPSNGYEARGQRGFCNVNSDRNYTSAAGGLRLIFDRVEVKGCMYAVMGLGAATLTDRKSGWFFNDCIFQENNDYLLFQASNLFFLGTQVIETYGEELGLMGRGRTGGADRGFKSHRAIRETVNWMIYIRACFFEARGGWSGQNGGETSYAPQPLMRLHEASDPFYRDGKRSYFCDSVLQGPFNMDLGGGSVEPGKRGAHFVLENNVIIYDPACFSPLAVAHMSGRKTIRNNQFICLDTPPGPSLAGKNISKFETGGSPSIGKFTQFIGIEDQRLAYQAALEILHNTFTMLRPNARVEGTYVVRNTEVRTFGGDLVDADFANVYDVEEGHNVNYAPNLTTPIGPTMSEIALPTGVRVLDVWMKMVWEIVRNFTLPSSVAPGGTTALIPYPDDWYGNATVQADYTGTGGNHSVRTESNDRVYTQLAFGGGSTHARNAITVNFQSGGFTVTNRHSSDTWSGNISVILHRGTTSMDADRLHTVSQAGVKLYRPTTPVAVDADIRSTLFDFTRTLRPSAGFAISPTGTNTAGALLPA